MPSIFSPNKHEQEQQLIIRKIQTKNQKSIKKLFIDKGNLNRNHQFLNMSKTQEKFGKVLKDSKTINQNQKSQMFLISYLMMKEGNARNFQTSQNAFKSTNFGDTSRNIEKNQILEKIQNIRLFQRQKKQNELLMRQKEEEKAWNWLRRVKQSNTILKLIKEIPPQELIEIRESQINIAYNLEVRAEGTMVISGDSLVTFGGLGFQINDQIDKYHLNRYEVEQAKNKLLMRYSTAHYQDENLIFVHGGQYKIYGKQKVTLSSTLVVNANTLQIKEFTQLNNISPKRKNHGCFVVDNRMFIFGGTNQSDDFQSDFFEINLAHETCQEVKCEGIFPKISSFSMVLIGYSNNHNLLAHLDPQNKKHRHHQNEGMIEKVRPKVFIFGGLNEFGQTVNDLFLITIGRRLKVRCMDTLGKKPAPRIGHSLTYISQINCLLIYGGRLLNAPGYPKNQVLNDVHLFNIQYNFYFKAQIDFPISRYNFLYCKKDNGIIFYGGLTENNFEDGKLIELVLAPGAVQKINKVLSQNSYSKQLII